MTDLFLDSRPVVFEKTAADVALPDDPNTWMHEVLQELNKAVPYVADFDVRVVMQRVDAEKGYGVGYFEVTSKTDLQPEIGEKARSSAGVKVIRVPILIDNRKLKPLDLLIDTAGKMLPLNEDRLRRALFRPQAFDTLETTPGDTTMIGQLYPPTREMFGLGGGVLSGGGWSKTGGDAKSQFEQWVLGEESQKTAGVATITEAAGMRGEDVTRGVREDARAIWGKWGGDGKGGSGGVLVGLDKDPDRDFTSPKNQKIPLPDGWKENPKEPAEAKLANLRAYLTHGALPGAAAGSLVGAGLGAATADPGDRGASALRGAGYGALGGAVFGTAGSLGDVARYNLVSKKSRALADDIEAIPEPIRQRVVELAAPSLRAIARAKQRTSDTARNVAAASGAALGITGGMAGSGVGKVRRKKEELKKRKQERALRKKAEDLTQSSRENIKPKNFAMPKADGPDDTGKYPIHDKDHARSALGLVGMHGSDSEKAKVRAAIVAKYPELLQKKGSLLESVLPTINEADFDEVVRCLDTETEVKVAFQRSPRHGHFLGILAEYEPTSIEDRENLVRKVAGYDVLQIRRVGGGNYAVKKASSGAWEPVEERINRGQLRLQFGEKIAMDVDAKGSVTSAAGSVVDKDSPEADRPEQITKFGLYKVQDVDGNDLIGYVFPNLYDTDGTPLPMALFTNGSQSAVQSDIAGVRVDSGANVAEGKIHGHGAFVRVLPNGRAEATIPYELEAELSQDGSVGYMGTAFDGRPVMVKLQHGLEAPTEIDGTVLLPDSFRWMPLRGGAVALVSSAGDIPKKASSDMFLRGDGSGRFSLEGSAVDSLPETDRSFLSTDGAMFVLAGAGVSPKLAADKLKAAFSGMAPVAVPFSRIIKSATALRKQAMQRVRDRASWVEDIKPPLLLKEASALSDPDTIDSVLSMGFLNEENLLTFLDFMPKLEEAQGKLCQLLLASRMGLSEIPEEAAVRVIPHLEKMISGLRTLAFQQDQ